MVYLNQSATQTEEHVNYSQLCESIEARLGLSVTDYDVEGIADEMVSIDLSPWSLSVLGVMSSSDVARIPEDEWDELITPHAAEATHRYPYNPNRF
jgi:hypothetical protein